MAGAFDATAYDNVGYYTGVVAPPAAVVDRGAGGGGREPALIAPFIRWGKKKKKKKEAIAEVADVIQQVMALAEAPPYIDPVERDILAERLLAVESLAQLRRVQTIETMLARINRELQEMDDEDTILLIS